MPSPSIDRDPVFLKGIEHFNERRFWDAHESWEELWLAAQDETEQFLQGLIQLAAAYHHLQRGTFSGGVRLFEAALRRLSAYPPDFCRVDRVAAEAAAVRDREWAGRRLAEGDSEKRLSDHDYPRLVLLD